MMTDHWAYETPGQWWNGRVLDERRTHTDVMLEVHPARTDNYMAAHDESSSGVNTAHDMAP